VSLERALDQSTIDVYYETSHACEDVRSIETRFDTLIIWGIIRASERPKQHSLLLSFSTFRLTIELRMIRCDSRHDRWIAAAGLRGLNCSSIGSWWPAKVRALYRKLIIGGVELRRATTVRGNARVCVNIYKRLRRHRRCLPLGSRCVPVFPNEAKVTSGQTRERKHSACSLASAASAGHRATWVRASNRSRLQDARMRFRFWIAEYIKAYTNTPNNKAPSEIKDIIR